MSQSVFSDDEVGRSLKLIFKITIKFIYNSDIIFEKFGLLNPRMYAIYFVFRSSTILSSASGLELTSFIYGLGSMDKLDVTGLTYRNGPVL